MELLIVRHAELVRIVDADGQADPPLHERGLAQAERLAAWPAGRQGPRMVRTLNETAHLRGTGLLGHVTRVTEEVLATG